MPKRGKNLTDLRASNQGAVLQYILTHGATSKQKLAAELQLTPMSISYIAAELQEKGYLRECEAEVTNAPGRPAAKLALVPERLLAVSVSVSRRSVRVSCVDMAGHVQRTHRTPHTADTTAASLTQRIIREIEAIAADNAVLGIGISCVGMVDIRSGTVVSTTDFYGIEDWPVVSLLQQHFGIQTVFIAEDMKAAALAESYYGAGKAYTDFVYVGVTHGIGAAVIAGGKLLEGSRGFSGELGHTTLYPNGARCACGNVGCAELYLSVPTVLAAAECDSWEAFAAVPSPAKDQFLTDLATVLTNVVNVFDPEAVGLGHEGALLTAEDYAALQAAVNARVMTRHFKQVAVLPSSLAHDITAQSGAAVVFSRCFSGEFKL